MKALLILSIIAVSPIVASGGTSRPDEAAEACTTPIASVVAVHTRNWSQIWLAPLKLDTRGAHLGKLVPITHRPGYNNQPAFSQDGQGFYYSWRPDNSEADIWYHEFRTGKERPITCTPQDEYSPALIPARKAISAVSLEDADKRRLWAIPLADGEPSLLFPNLSSIAYYAWVDADTVILSLTDPDKAQMMTLAIGNVSTGSIERIGSAGSQSLARVPNSTAVSYVDKRESQSSRLMEIDAVSHELSAVLTLPESVETYAWLPDGRIIAPMHSLILTWSPHEPAWKQIADLSAQMPNGISRLVVNDKGNRIGLVTPVK